MHTYRQSCIRNNLLLVEYVEQLGLLGGEIGSARVDVSEFRSFSIAGREEYVNCDELKPDNAIKVEPEEEDPLRGGDYEYVVPKCEFDYSETVKNETVVEEAECEFGSYVGKKCYGVKRN